MKLTLEALEKMPDSQMSELTAALRGWTLEKATQFLDAEWKIQFLGQYREGNNLLTPFISLNAPEFVVGERWNPAINTAQAYDLLLWLAEMPQCSFRIWRSSQKSNIAIWLEDCPSQIRFDKCAVYIAGHDAKRMCIAFVLAMLHEKSPSDLDLSKFEEEQAKLEALCTCGHPDHYHQNGIGNCVTGIASLTGNRCECEVYKPDPFDRVFDAKTLYLTPRTPFDAKIANAVLETLGLPKTLCVELDTLTKAGPR